MISSSELKRQAKSQLSGKWGLAIGGFFIAIFFFPFMIDIINLFISGSLATTIIKYSLSIILRFILIVGILKFSLNYADSKKTPFLDDIFSGFKIAIKALSIYIIMIICIAFGLALLIVPGIIVSLAFSQAFYILIDDNNKSAIDCLKESVDMMKGHKKDCLILSLSFLGWLVLMIVPIFILKLFPLPIFVGVLYLLILSAGLLWLFIYMNITFAHFYLHIKKDYSNVSENDILNT